MTRDELLIFTMKRRSAGVSGGSIQTALKIFQTERAVFFPSDAAALLELAARIDASSTEKKAMISLSEIDLHKSEKLFVEVENQIKKIRNKTFGSEEPAFQSNEKAKCWLEKTSRTEWAKVKRPSKEKQKIERSKEVKALCQRLQTLSNSYVVLQSPALPYSWEGWTVNVPCLPVGILDRIRIDVERISKQYNIPKAAVTMWLLCGIRPVVAPIEVYDRSIYIQDKEATSKAKEYRVKALRFQIQVLINSPDVTRTKWNELYRMIKRSKNEREPFPKKEFHFRIKEIVTQEGGEPEYGKKTEFWKKIIKQLEKEGYRNVPRWQGIRKAYRQLTQPKPKATQAEWFEVHSDKKS